MLFRIVISVFVILLLGALFVFTPSTSTPQHSTSSPAPAAEEPVQRGLKAE